MTTDYADAYRIERMAHADMRRREREAASKHRANRIASAGHPIRTAMGNQLIRMGQRLSAASAPLTSEIRDVA